MCIKIFRPKVIVDYQRVGGASFPFIGMALAKSPKAKQVLVTGLVDSGASISVISWQVASQLGVRTESGVRREVNTAGGVIIGYEHKLNAWIGKHRFVLPVIVSRELETEVTLFGRRGFFETFRVYFEEERGKVILS